ncbi:MAG: MAPEG family protein [Gammaproteobacteria bacterium]|nr:MAPEG family protein [Gammaproteobacteria bacterium]
MLAIKITSLYAGLYAFLILILAFRVVKFRRTNKVGVGFGGSRSGEVLVRTHANAVEYIPIALLLMLIAEINGLSAMWLHSLGSIFFLARIAHAFGLIASKGGYHLGRFTGTLFSWIVIIVLAVVNITYAVF